MVDDSEDSEEPNVTDSGYKSIHPSDQCGYVWPADCEHVDHKDWLYLIGQFSCVRSPLPDVDRCVWHADPKETNEKTVEALQDARVLGEFQKLSHSSVNVLDGANLWRADLSGANLRNADLPGATLDRACLSEANLRDVDLSGANLSRAVLTEVNLWRADLSGANLWRADLSGTNLRNADLSEAILRDANLSEVDLRGADLSDADLREVDISDALFTQATKCSRQMRAEERGPTSPDDWDEIARAYHALKIRLSDQGLVGKARRQYLEERRARRLEAKADGDYLAFGFSWASRYVTGYGMDLKIVLLVMSAIFVIPTVWYWLYGFDTGFYSSIYYGVVTFVTAPPPTPVITDGVTWSAAIAQTFLGTLSTVLLGYVLAIRESI